jgi:hypothetical protein
MKTFWDIAPSSLVGVDRRFRGVHCIHHQGSFITVVVEAAHTSETSVYSDETRRRYIPEGSHLHTPRRENLKSRRLLMVRMVRTNS